MTTTDGRNNPYQAPQAPEIPAVKGGSAWGRFWLSCLVWLLPIPVLAMILFGLLPAGTMFVLFGLSVLWLATVSWVLRPRGGNSILMRIATAMALTICLIACFAAGAALIVAPLFNHQIDVTLPRRGV